MGPSCSLPIPVSKETNSTNSVHILNYSCVYMSTAAAQLHFLHNIYIIWKTYCLGLCLFFFMKPKYLSKSFNELYELSVCSGAAIAKVQAPTPNQMWTCAPKAPLAHYDGRSQCHSRKEQSSDVWKPQHQTHQYHVTGGDVHVGRHGLLAPGGGAAAGGGAGGHAVAELRGDAVEARVAQGLRPLHALRGSDRHPLAAKLLGEDGRRGRDELAVMKGHYLQPRRAARVFVCLSCALLSCRVGYVLILLQGGRKKPHLYVRRLTGSVLTRL